MASNTSLKKLGVARQDEFYTQLSDIEKELRHYWKHFKGKTVLCNCDDPYESNFFKYFAVNFNRLGLKKLIASCYAGSPIANRQYGLFSVCSKQANGYKAVVTQVYDKNSGGMDMHDVAELLHSKENVLRRLDGDGDFRSPECIELLKEADIVVTNPPFSLFREYVMTLVAYEKKFIIVGSQNAIVYKEIFPLIRDKKVWLGHGFRDNAGYFVSPYEDKARSNTHITGLVRVSGVMWFTNLDLEKRHERIILVRQYDPETYPTYDNFDAIEVGKTANIPFDYKGAMGVPITYMTVHNPDQFEIIGLSDRDSPLRVKIYTRADSPKYNGFNRGCTIRQQDGTLKSTYMRIFIRNLHPEDAKADREEK